LSISLNNGLLKQTCDYVMCGPHLSKIQIAWKPTNVEWQLISTAVIDDQSHCVLSF
jgi:hypothetical protein